MVIGNPHYNSILRCPNGYSWNGALIKTGSVRSAVIQMT